MKKEVLLIFKTHLDLGFTDYAENIVNQYLLEYIPTAIKVGNELQGSQTPFCWTLGSWLVNEALKRDSDGLVEKAIQDGIFSWHALPFTTHTELMSKELLECGLQISKQLDKRFGKETVAAKMTDVPGHTIAMVPQLVQKGITFLHIGVNPATPLPPVPSVFRWKTGKHALTVMYQGDYGEVADFDDFVVYFAHTNDNKGPQSAEEIRGIYLKVQELYPNCRVKASTLDEVANKLQHIKNLPEISEEIGDTWIHGAATDPQKLSRYRRILRYLKENNPEEYDFTDTLLAVPEHTWGMDVKTFFPDMNHFMDLEADELAMQRKTIEASWQEQRNYVTAAEKILGLKPDYPTGIPDLSSWTEISLPKEIGFSLCWQIFDHSDYERYQLTYLRSEEDWAIRDFTKVGLPDYSGGIYQAIVRKAYQNGEKTLLRLEFEPDIHKTYGLPYFYATLSDGYLELKWFGKKASRLPQACWLRLKGFEEKWELCKLDTWIPAEKVIGSPLICAVEAVRNSQIVIEPLDSALVAPFGKRLLQYQIGDVPQNLEFNLYNNIWNTNFPMWYSDDAVFRFRIRKRV